ncbi:cysteine-rich receptor-like protein kinase 10 [Cryptomeria japonica]|uniref:cysteine-rich receptor-like protein kinase 10 n=1 Tax=Cryptomeria japonica TaxID=3369 RepID=UPI0027DA9385|nr:cysteine-rich receptor-like protein kinase 10 [Cryptomeria japonica]
MRCSSSFPKICRDMLLPLLFLMILPSVICDYRWSVCNNASTYTEGSTYSTNLDRVINDLSRNAPLSSGFNTSSRGQSPNKAYGLLQCIGNVSAARCSNCSVQVNNITQELCANDIGARVWMDDCFMRYDNSNFISTLDTNFLLLENTQNVTSNMQGFISTTSSLLSNLSEKAYISANKLLGIGSESYYTSDKVYGLVQCWRDLSVKDCRSCLFQARQALEQCCSSRQGAQAMSASCTVRFEIYPFVESGNLSSSPSPSPEASSPPPTTSPTSSPPVALGPSEPTSQGKSNKSSKTLPIVLGVVIGVVLVLLICLIAMRKRVKSAIFGRPITTATHNEDRHAFSPQSGLLQQEQRFIFSLEELAEATENFHDNNKLGEGGFGSVYKGRTKDGKQIAVKKLSAKSRQGKEEFMNEVKLMANVQHRNLVKLFGCCVEGDERLIVYEYLPNKSLDTFLFDPEKRRLLDWEKRYNIIIGVARGLLYLHEDSQMKIIHRDIKANNILLDDKLHPKIADFGLAKLFGEDESHVQTRVAGTYGYMAPEYAMQGQLSVKADVYSFGVLLLEIVSGRKNLDTHLAPGMQNLLEWAWRLYKSGNIMGIVDSTVLETCLEEQALRCIHVGFVCVQADAALRPPISNVIMMISSSSVTLPNATKPAFVSGSEKNVSKSSSEVEENEKGTVSMTTSSGSVNEASVTAVQSR